MGRLIDADVLKEMVLKSGYSVRLDRYTGRWPCLLVADIKKVPTVDAVEVVHGKWLDVFYGLNHFAATCSACNKRSDLPPIAVSKYCPRCGARMDGENNEYA